MALVEDPSPHLNWRDWEKVDAIEKILNYARWKFSHLLSVTEITLHTGIFSLLSLVNQCMKVKYEVRSILFHVV